MSNDLILVMGVVIGLLAIPSVIGAFSRGNPPRAALILFMIGGSMIVWAVFQQPNTYNVETFPSVFSSVVRNILR